MSVSTEVEALLSPIAEGVGAEVVCVEISQSNQKTQICVYVDKPDGIGIDEIAKLSRQFEANLDASKRFDENYLLEVSSPGLNRPLTKPKHFQAQLGETIKVSLMAPNLEGRKNFQGELTAVNDASIVMSVDGDSHEFDYDAIHKARLVYSF